jgi:hypothetical protein
MSDDDAPPAACGHITANSHFQLVHSSKRRFALLASTEHHAWTDRRTLADFSEKSNYAVLNKQSPGGFLTVRLDFTSKENSNVLLLSKRSRAIILLEI